MSDWGKIGALFGGLVVLGMFGIHYVDNVNNPKEINNTKEISRIEQQLIDLQEENERLQKELAEAQLEAMKAELSRQVYSGELGPKLPEIPEIEFEPFEYQEVELGPSAEERIAQELEEMNRREMFEDMREDIDNLFK